MEYFVIKNNQLEGRLDSFFYLPEFIKLENKVKKLTDKKLGDYVISMAGGETPDRKKESEYYTDSSGVPFLRVQNVEDGGLDLTNCKFINRKTHEGKLKRSQVKENDMITKITGVGRMAISVVIPENFEGNINQHLVVIKTKDRATSEGLAAFLNSDIGERLAFRRSTGGTRPALDYDALKSVPIVFKPEIVKIMSESYTYKKQKETQAKQLLDSVNKFTLDKLKLEPIQTENELCYNLKFNDLRNNRLDPYYFKTVFTKFEDTLQNRKDIEPLSELCEDIFSGKTPANDEYADTGKPIIKASCLKNNKINWDNLSAVQENIALSENVQDNDILILSSAHHAEYLGKNPCIVEIPKNLRDENISFVGELINIRPKKGRIEPYYLLSILKLHEYHLLISREKRGQSSHLYAEDLGKIMIPLPSIPIQQIIAEKVKKCLEQAQILKQEAMDKVKTVKTQVDKIILQI